MSDDAVSIDVEVLQVALRMLLAHAEAERDRWLDWLVETGFGIDYWTPEHPPPCTADEYGEAWHRHDPSESAATWKQCVADETGQPFIDQDASE